MGKQLNILVTGGNGFLGNNLIKKLIQNNHKVLILSKNKNNLFSILDKCSFIEGYTEDVLKHKETILKFSPDIVVHFGWDGGNNYKSTNSLEQYYNNIPQNIIFLNFLNELPKKPKFVGVGSYAEYGQVTNLVKEDVIESPLNYYGMAKLIFKNFSESFCKINNIEWVWIRPCFIYGPGDVNTRLIPRLIDTFIQNKDIELDECKVMIDLLYIEDFVNFTYNLILSPHQGIYNISSGMVYPLREIISKIHTLINSKSNILFNPSINRINTQQYIGANNLKIQQITKINNITNLNEGLIKTINFYKNEL